tara:strand:- start:704 stop:868 length:165 start_codon:yes stop_codon:yes gene_type:complete
MATPWYNLHDGFDVAEARGQGECPGKAGGALQQAAASGRAASDWTASERAADAA